MDLTKQTLATLTEMLREQRGENLGAGEHVVRCAPGTAQFRLPASVRRAPAPPSDESDSDTRAKNSETREAPDSFRLEGVASSTSVDWYGTEMSPRALESMREQFTRGVDVFPRHGGFLDTIEWDEVVGRTDTAIMQETSVAEAADPSERGFILKVQADINRAAPRAVELERRIDEGQPIGLSIGGWVTEIRYVTDEDGEVIRVIIEDVSLDHVALVRSPANPDSHGLKVLREAGDASTVRATAKPSPTAEEVLGGLEARHVMRVDVEDDAIVLRIAKGTSSESSDDEADEAELSAPVGGAPSGGTSDRGSDNNSETGEDARGTNGDAPNARSETMSDTKLDAILSALGDVKATQDRTAERLEVIEARAAAPIVEATADTTIVVKTEEEQAAEIARAVETALEARDVAAAAAAAAAAPEVNPEVAELRAKVEGLTAERDNRDIALANLVGSGRMGRSSRMAAPVLGGGYDSEQALNDIDGLVARCKSEGDKAPTLCAVINRHKDAISITREASGHLPKGTRGAAYNQASHNAPSTLRSILVGAERDGIIGDLNRGWATN